MVRCSSVVMNTKKRVDVMPPVTDHCTSDVGADVNFLHTASFAFTLLASCCLCLHKFPLYLLKRRTFCLPSQTANGFTRNDEG